MAAGASGVVIDFIDAPGFARFVASATISGMAATVPWPGFDRQMYRRGI